MDQSFRFPITALLAFYPITRRKNTKIWPCTGFIFNHFVPIPLPMPRNRVFNNLDHVPADLQATKVSKVFPPPSPGSSQSTRHYELLLPIGVVISLLTSWLTNLMRSLPCSSTMKPLLSSPTMPMSTPKYIQLQPTSLTREHGLQR